MADAITINDVVFAARETIVGLHAALLDPNSATAKGALASAADNLAGLERSLRLCEYEAKRQREIADRRAQKAEAEKKAAAELASAQADRRHAAVLVQAGDKIAAEKAAAAHFAKKGK